MFPKLQFAILAEITARAITAGIAWQALCSGNPEQCGIAEALLGTASVLTLLAISIIMIRIIIGKTGITWTAREKMLVQIFLPVIALAIGSILGKSKGVLVSGLIIIFSIILGNTLRTFNRIHETAANLYASILTFSQKRLTLRIITFIILLLALGAAGGALMGLLLPLPQQVQVLDSVIHRAINGAIMTVLIIPFIGLYKKNNRRPAVQ